MKIAGIGNVNIDTTREERIRTVRAFFQHYIKITKRLSRKVIKSLAECNYYSARAYYKYELQRSSHKYKGPPLVIFQMGKVGSITIQRSLEALELNMPIYHPHFLTKKRIAETEVKRKKYFRTEKYSYLKRPWLYQFLRDQIETGLDGNKWKIVSLTREPIGRNISTFFENLEVRLLQSPDEYEIQSDYYGIEPTIVKLDDMNELIRLFFEKLNHDSPLVFFDQELKGVFTVDVFASEFPKSKGFEIYESEKADVLLIRLENLNYCAQEAFKSFLDIDNFTLHNANIGAEKAYAPIYEMFKESVMFPDSYLDKFYNSKFMRHFYSSEEIAQFEDKWRR